MYAVLCKKIGNIIVGVCGAYIYSHSIVFRKARSPYQRCKYKVNLHVCVCVCVCCYMDKQNSPYSVVLLVWTLRWPV